MKTLVEILQAAGFITLIGAVWVAIPILGMILAIGVGMAIFVLLIKDYREDKENERDDSQP